MNTNPFVELVDISKSFPGVKALSDVSIAFYPGKVHVLLGENGAGKSTIIKIISGVYQADAGKLLVGGQEYTFTNTRQALAHGVSVIHNPTSNLKLGSGFAPIRQMMDKGINVTLGTDGTASNNNLNMFEEMHLAEIMHDGYHNDPTLISTQEVLDMATVNGAKLQGRDDTGVLAVGKKADIIAIDLSKPHLYPNFDTPALLTCSAQAGDVCMTMVDGKILYENGEFKTLDENKVRADMERAVERLYRK